MPFPYETETLLRRRLKVRQGRNKWNSFAPGRDSRPGSGMFGGCVAARVVPAKVFPSSHRPHSLPFSLPVMPGSSHYASSFGYRFG